MANIYGAGAQIIAKGFASAKSNRVEEVVVVEPRAGSLYAVGKHARQIMQTMRDLGQSLRPMIYGVHSSHDRQEHLRRADVAGGAFAADVLFAGLQGQAIRGVASGIFG